MRKIIIPVLAGLIVAFGVHANVFDIFKNVFDIRVEDEEPVLGQGAPVFFPSASGPEYVISITDGCAEWSTNVLTSSGSACGSGGGGAGLSTSTAIADTEIIFGTAVNTVGSNNLFTFEDGTTQLQLGTTTTPAVNVLATLTASTTATTKLLSFVNHNATEVGFVDDDGLASLSDLQVNSLSFTFADAGANAFFGWDDAAGDYQNLTAGEALTVIGGAANDFDGNGDVTDISCTDCINATEIEDIYLLNNGDAGTGLHTFADARPAILNATTTTVGTLTAYGNVSLQAATSTSFAITGYSGGGDQCLRVNDDGTIEATGSDCGSGGEWTDQGNYIVPTEDGDAVLIGTTTAPAVNVQTTIAASSTVVTKLLSGINDTTAEVFSITDEGLLTLADDLVVTGGDITLATSLIFSGGDTTSLNLIDAIDATTETTIEAAIDTLANLTSASSLVTVGALNSGSITSGFGNIDIGSSNLDADGTVTFGGLSILSDGRIAILNATTSVIDTLTVTATTTSADVNITNNLLIGSAYEKGIIHKSYRIASSTEVSEGGGTVVSYNSATTTEHVANFSGTITLNQYYCETDTGTAMVRIGDGTNWADALNAVEAGAEDTSLSNNTWIDREDVVIEVGDITGTTTSNHVVCDFEFINTDVN